MENLLYCVLRFPSSVSNGMHIPLSGIAAVALASSRSRPAAPAAPRSPHPKRPMLNQKTRLHRGTKLQVVASPTCPTSAVGAEWEAGHACKYSYCHRLLLSSCSPDAAPYLTGALPAARLLFCLFVRLAAGGGGGMVASKCLNMVSKGLAWKAGWCSTCCSRALSCTLRWGGTRER